MSSQTPNINLTLPTGAEKVSRQIINDNNTKIDTAIGTLNDKLTKFVNVGIVDASANTPLARVQAVIDAVDTGGSDVNFIGIGRASGNQYVCGVLYSGKLYGGGYYSNPWEYGYWKIDNGTLTIDNLNTLFARYKVYTVNSNSYLDIDTTNPSFCMFSETDSNFAFAYIGGQTVTIIGGTLSGNSITKVSTYKTRFTNTKSWGCRVWLFNYD